MYLLDPEFKEAIGKLGVILADARDMQKLPIDFVAEDISINLKAIELVKEWVYDTFKLDIEIEDNPLGEDLPQNLYNIRD